MPQWLNVWNRRLSHWLWWIVLVGVVAALPVMYARAQTESSANKVAVVVDYRDLLQVSSTKGEPEAFLDEQLAKLKEAGVNGMAVFESTLQELSWAGEVEVYTATEAALLEGKTAADAGNNRTYVMFTKPGDADTIRSMIDWAFKKHGFDVADWSYEGQKGVSIDMGIDDAMIRPMQPNPLEMDRLHAAGYQLYPRLSDRFSPYDRDEMKRWIESFEKYGVTRVLFDGEGVPGFSEPAKNKAIENLADLLKEHGMGIGAFENMKAPTKGLSSLAKDLDYNVVRAHSLSDGELAKLTVEQLQDRLFLAVKDRDIRLIYLHTLALRDSVKGKMTNPLEMIVDTLMGAEKSDDTDDTIDTSTVSEGTVEATALEREVGFIEKMSDFGFELGVPQAFDVHHAPAEKALRGLAMAGAIALVALMLGLFAPALLLPVTVIGYIGAAGLYVLAPTLMVQMLALFAAIAAPTVAVVLLVRKIRERRDAELSNGRKLGAALLLFVKTSVLSIAAVPLVVAMLNHITYSLVLQQFRGVSLLHLAPIALVAIYVFLYGSGDTVIGNARRILMMPVTFFWVVLIGVGAAAGMYYLTRTGNAGQVSGLELAFRSFLENTFGVRPRTKEFLIGHPLMLAGIFIALRYRWAMILLAMATIAQLSMVDTFAHIHTPLAMSIIRVLLGLGMGIVIGLIAVGVWRIIEKTWGRVEKYALDK
ncbi:DUF5693 family protein [Cohnella faecalis]|uniref:DUF5693 family protein n=1 Tax=Cohnella faecalis TaxID=2315694 RepID=UPI00361DB6FE